MSRLIVVVSLAFASLSSVTAAAHDGHGATPAHLHVEGMPVDLGLIAMTLAAMAPLVMRVWRRTARSPLR